MTLTGADFEAYFDGLHGQAPFPWQTGLVERIFATGQWPAVIDLPTASGKTACLDIAVFLLAATGTGPRRMYFVVDRRVVVNEAFQRMKRVAKALLEPANPVVAEVASRLQELAGGGDADPLDVYELRGGIYRDQSWVRSPLQPTVITSTVDQVGSRLLFRGYGVSEYSRPIHAALTANDSLILLDEAHCSTAFAQTLDRVKRFRGWAQEDLGSAFVTVEMTATPSKSSPPDDVFRLTDKDRQHPVLRQRLFSAKPTTLESVTTKGNDMGPLVKRLAEQAVTFAKEPHLKAVAVMVNRIATARATAEVLRKSGEKVDLLIGRMRSLDRDDLLARLEPLHSGKRTAETPRQFVVSTQCLEVGADLDFDALVTECASVDALMQRFGRLDRLGRLQGQARGCVLTPSSRVEGKEPDPIYGEALNATWSWLQKSGGEEKQLDFGILSGDRPVQTVAEQAAALQDASTLRRDGKNAVVLLPTHLDVLVQTCPAPAIEPDVALFLHGTETGSPDVQVVWRADLPDSDEKLALQILTLCPPSSGEAMPVRLWDFKSWMDGKGASPNDADLEGIPEENEPARKGPRRPVQTIHTVIAWRGKDSKLIHYSGDVRPGDTLVIQASAPSASLLGHIPAEGQLAESVLDWGDRAAMSGKRRLSLRLNPQVMKQWPVQPSLDLSQLIAGFDTEGTDRRAQWELIRVALREFRQTVEEPQWFLALLDAALKTKATPALHPGGGLVVQRAMPKERPEEDGGEDEKSFGWTETLAAHTERVRQEAKRIAAAVIPGLTQTIEETARYHDLGKCDIRFQTLLRGGNRLAAEMSPVLLAKSRLTGFRSDDLPSGFRHEFLSLLFAEDTSSSFEKPELVLHLIASHHGRARPHAPVVIDAEPPDADAGFGAISREIRLARPAHHLASGVTRRFWRLTRHFGWWGLAYLECVFRLGDWAASERSGSE